MKPDHTAFKNCLKSIGAIEYRQGCRGVDDIKHRKWKTIMASSNIIKVSQEPSVLDAKGIRSKS